MSETYSPAGNVSAQTFKRATVGEAATGTFGDEFMRQDNTQIADRIRFLDDNGFLNTSKVMFPATQVPSAGANDLDDYEEGTFTPLVQFSGLSVGVTYTTQTGKYTKIGNRVFFSLVVVLSSKGSSAGTATVAGLPFTPASSGQSAVAGLPVFTGVTGIVTVGITGTTALSLRIHNNGGEANLDDTKCTNVTQFVISGQFEV